MVSSPEGAPYVASLGLSPGLGVNHVFLSDLGTSTYQIKIPQPATLALPMLCLSWNGSTFPKTSWWNGKSLSPSLTCFLLPHQSYGVFSGTSAFLVEAYNSILIYFQSLPFYMIQRSNLTQMRVLFRRFSKFLQLGHLNKPHLSGSGSSSGRGKSPSPPRQVLPRWCSGQVQSQEGLAAALPNPLTWLPGAAVFLQWKFTSSLSFRRI